MGVLALCGMVAAPGWAGVSKTGDIKDDGSSFYAGYNDNSTGTLTIDAGSVFSRRDGDLGFAMGSTGTAIITGAGSTWTNSGSLCVGCSGSGTLRVEAGGQVSESTAWLGYQSGSMGAAVITGAGSK